MQPATAPDPQTAAAPTDAAASAVPFLVRVRDELLDSLGRTFGLFQGEGGGWSARLADLLTQLLVAALIVALFVVAYRLLRRGVRFAFRRTRLPDELRAPVVHALRYVVVLFAGLAVLASFGVDGDLLGQIATGALFAFLFYLGWLAGNRFLTASLRRTEIDPSLEQLLRNVLGVLVGAIGFIMVLGQFGVDVLAAITTLGIVGIAVGFAAQETLSNFIAGVTLLIERPFRIGDWVEIGGTTGRVEEISLRTTRIVTRDNVLTSVPNANVASSDILNLSGGGPLRVQIPLGIAYKESAAAAREVLLPILQDHPDVLQGGDRAPAVRMAELADSSVNLVLLAWVRPEDIGRSPAIAAEVLERAKETLDEAGIEIPFPHLQLFVDDAEGLRPVLEPLYARRNG